MTPTGMLTGKAEKGPQESECPDLHGKPQPVMVSTTLCDELAIVVVQVKIAGELRSALVRQCSARSVALVPRSDNQQACVWSSSFLEIG